MLPIFLSLLSLQTRAGHVELSTRLDCEWFRPGGSKWTNVTYRYSIRLSATNWHIVDLQQNEYAEVYGDGTSIYEAFYGNLAITNRPAAATILSGMYPARANYRTTVPWLGWCSHLLLGSADLDSVPLPTYRACSEPLAHICQSKVRLSALMPRLPAEIEFIVSQGRLDAAATNAFLDREGVTEIEKLGRLQRLDPEFRPGTHLAKFSVTAWTNVGGMTIPREFEFLDFRIDQGAKRAASATSTSTSTPGAPSIVYTSARYRGIVESIGFHEAPLLIPSLLRVAAVSDFRQRDTQREIDHVRYFVKDRKWREKINPQIEASFRRRQAESDRIQKKQLLIRSIMFLVMLVIPAVPLVMWFRQKTGRSDQQQMRKDSK